MKWHKVKVGDFLIRVKDLVPIIDNEEYNLVTIKLYHRGVQLRKKVRGAEMQAEKMSKVKAGQFILSGIDARNGAFGIIPKELEGAVVTNDFWHFEIDRNIMSNEYFLWLSSTPYFDDICNKASDGTTNRIRLQSDRFYSQELLIPEIQYQHKVVEELKSTNNKIKSLETEYQFQLTQLENLNQAILQEAVQGKLVKQDKKDEPASELLKRIKAEKVKSGRKEKPLPPIKPEEIPFEIPENWVWCRLGEMCFNHDGERKPIAQSERNGRKKIYDYYGASGVIDKIDGYTHEGELLLIGEDGANLIARSTPIAFIAKGQFWVNNHAHVIDTVDRITLDYLCCYINSMDLKPFVTGGFQPKLSQGNLNIIHVPLPPLTEQKRIISEIEKQLAKTKQLKEHIISNQQATEQLLKALLHQAFEVEEMKEV